MADAAVVGQPLTFGDGLGGRGVRRAAPGLGDQTDAILAELGRTADDVAALRAAGVI